MKVRGWACECKLVEHGTMIPDRERLSQKDGVATIAV
jgi:hypothetical protein